MSLAYLACPYSHKDKKVREKRFEEANKAAAWLMRWGNRVFSPISHSHPISECISEKNSTDWRFWREQDIQVLKHCDQLFVLCIDGWRKSKGVEEEIELAKKFDMEIIYLIVDRYGVFEETLEKP